MSVVEFVNSCGWVIPSTNPTDPIAPSPGTGSTTAPPPHNESPASTDDYDISEFDIVGRQKGKGKGKGKGKASTSATGPKRYTPKETLYLAGVFIDVSQDPIVGNQQSSKAFWLKVTDLYNAGRPKDTFERDFDKLRKHWSRVQKDVSKWNGKWLNVSRIYRSGANDTDLIGMANDEFYVDERRPFKFYDVWKLLHKSPKWSGGAEADNSGPKRSKVSASGNYSSSGGPPPIDLNVPDDVPNVSSPASYQPRPMGTKAAKRKAKEKSTATSAPPASENSEALKQMSQGMLSMSISLQLGYLTDLMARDTSMMSPEELRMHRQTIDYIRASLKME